MINTDFIRRLHGRVAGLAIGPSTFHCTPNIVKPARGALAEIDLRSLAKADPISFDELLEERTQALQAQLSNLSDGSSWGRERKALNISLRDVVYNVDLRDSYNLAKIRPWLEIPLDSQVAKANRCAWLRPGIINPRRSQRVIIIFSRRLCEFHQLAALLYQRHRRWRRVDLR